MQQKTYSVVMALELTVIGVKFEGSNTNPFNQVTPITLLFYSAAFCHAIASTTDNNVPVTVIIFHVSGLLGCDSLFWILIAELLWYCVINLLLLLVASLCFFNHYFAYVIHLLLDAAAAGTPFKLRHVPNAQPQHAQP